MSFSSGLFGVRRADEDEPSEKKPKGARCPLCDHRIKVNGSMKQHVDAAHGAGSWKALQSVLARRADKERRALLLAVYFERVESEGRADEHLR